MLQYRSYAKINLYLDVLDKRPDGYHNIETVFQTVDLWDALSFEEAPCEISLECVGAELPCDSTNLVYRAALLLRNHAGVRQGVRMRLEKHIPVAAGLAGGSGNAAAALIALNALWRMDLPEAKLAELALELGSDVPYCLQGGAKAATGRGECLEALPLPPPMWFVLVHPPIAVSTRSIYTSPYLVRNLEPALDGRTPSFRRALERLEAGDIAGAVFNRMETAAFRHYPPLQAIKERLLEAGCSAAAMSGSGPTMFGVCHSEAQAQLAASAFDEYDVTLARSKEHGVVCANRDKA